MEQVSPERVPFTVVAQFMRSVLEPVRDHVGKQTGAAHALVKCSIVGFAAARLFDDAHDMAGF